MEIRTIDLYSSFTEGLHEIYIKNNSDSRSEDESFRDTQLDKIEQAYNPNANNIVEIRDSLLARKDDIVIFISQDGEPWRTMVRIC